MLYFSFINFYCQGRQLDWAEAYSKLGQKCTIDVAKGYENFLEAVADCKRVVADFSTLKMLEILRNIKFLLKLLDF